MQKEHFSNFMNSQQLLSNFKIFWATFEQLSVEEFWPSFLKSLILATDLLSSHARTFNPWWVISCRRKTNKQKNYLPSRQVAFRKPPFLLNPSSLSIREKGSYALRITNSHKHKLGLEWLPFNSFEWWSLAVFFSFSFEKNHVFTENEQGKFVVMQRSSGRP